MKKKLGLWIYVKSQTTYIYGIAIDSKVVGQWTIRYGFFSCVSSRDTTETYNSIEFANKSQSKIMGMGNTSEKGKQGRWILFEDDSFTTGEFKNNLRVGYWEFDYGSREVYGRYKKGKKHGTWETAYYGACNADGYRMRTSSYFYEYKNGKADGWSRHVRWATW